MTAPALPDAGAVCPVAPASAAALACDAAPGPVDGHASGETLMSVLPGAAAPPVDPLPPVQDDDLVIAALVDELLTTLHIDRSQDLVTELVVTLGSAAARTVQRWGGGRYNPENPVDNRGLTKALRGLLNFSGDGPVGLDEARKLAAAGVAQLAKALNLDVGALPDLLTALDGGLAAEPDTDALDPIMGILDIFWDEPDTQDPPVWESPLTPPPADDPLAKLVAARPQPIQPRAIPSNIVTELLKWLDVPLLRRLLRAAVPGALRRQASTYAKGFAALKNTDADGYAAENAIRREYLVARAGREVLVGTSVGTFAGGALSTKLLSAAAGTDVLWDTIKTGLISFLTGGVGAPDILDPYVAPGIGHVYEIKPAKRARDGVKQLYGRYLFWLNLAEVALANGTVMVLEAAAWAAGLCTGTPAPPFPANGRTLKPPQRLWMAGDWKPQTEITAGNRVILTEVPVPGVICYRVMKKDDEEEPSTVPVPAADAAQKATLLAALLIAAAAAGNLDRPEGAQALAAYWQDRYPGLSTGPTTTEEWEATKSVLIIAGAVVGVGLALLTLPVLTPILTTTAIELLAAGGAEALLNAAAQP